MELFQEKLTWLNILYNKMHHPKNITSSSVVKRKWKKALLKTSSLTTSDFMNPWFCACCGSMNP